MSPSVPPTGSQEELKQVDSTPCTHKCNVFGLIGGTVALLYKLGEGKPAEG